MAPRPQTTHFGRFRMRHVGKFNMAPLGTTWRRLMIRFHVVRHVSRLMSATWYRLSLLLATGVPSAPSAP